MKSKRLIRSYFIFLACIWLLSYSGAFTLFLDGGARAQGLSNTYERTNIGKIIEFAAIPMTIVGIVLHLASANRLSVGRWWLRSPGAQLGMLLFLVSSAQALSGVPFSNSMALLVVFSCLMPFSISLISRHVAPQTLFAALNYLYFFCLYLSIFLAVALPSYGISQNDGNAWQGMFSHKNNLGVFVSSYVLVALHCKTSAPKLTGINLLGSILLLTFAQSYTSAFAFSVGLVLLTVWPLAGLPRFSTRLAFFLLTAAASIFVVSLSFGSSNQEFFSKDISFSGRNLIWQLSLDEIQSSPWFGRGMGSLGFAVSSDSDRYLMATGQLLSSHHNGFIGSIYDLGLIASLLIGVVLLRPIFDAHRASKFWTYAAFSAMLLLIVVNTFEEKLLSQGPYIVLFLLIVCGRERYPTRGQNHDSKEPPF